MEDRYSPISPAKQEMIIMKKIANTSVNFLKEKYNDDIVVNEHVNNLSAKFGSSLNYFTNSLQNGLVLNGNDPLKRYQEIALQLLDKQRELLNQMNQHSEFDEDLVRRHLILLDLEETKLREKLPHDARIK